MQRFLTPAAGSPAQAKMLRHPSSSRLGFKTMHLAIKDNAESRTMGEASVAHRRITRITDVSRSRRLGSFSSIYITLFRLRLRTFAWSLVIELRSTFRIVSKALQKLEFKTVKIYANLPWAVEILLSNCLRKKEKKLMLGQGRVMFTKHTCVSPARTDQKTASQRDAHQPRLHYRIRPRPCPLSYSRRSRRFWPTAPERIP